MKANNGSGNIEERDEWQTPQRLWDKLNILYQFELDCCSTKGNSKCKRYCSDFCYLSLVTAKTWMNPPFSKALDMFKHFFKVVKQGVAIYRCDNFETKLWQEVIFPNANWVFIPNKRIAYEGMEGKGSRFPSALIGLNVPKPIGIEGTCLRIVTKK